MRVTALPDSASETSRLLSELDHALDRSGLLRDILQRYEKIRQIENITGPTQITRVMRKELQVLEQRLRLSETSSAQGAYYSVA